MVEESHEFNPSLFPVISARFDFFLIEAMEMTNGSNCRIELLLFYLNYFIYFLMLELTTCFEIISLVHFIFGCYFLSWVL